LSDEILKAIIKLQLGRIEKRIRENHGIPFTYDDEVIHLIGERCTELESGARVVDAILTNTVLPAISAEFLTKMVGGDGVSGVRVSVKEREFNYAFN
jgi:type VI secretion system protein VasG